MSKKFFIPVFLFLIGLANAQAPDSQIVIIHDLRNDLLVFDEAGRSYVPFVGESIANETSVSFMLDVQKHKNYNLYVQAPAGTSVFLEGKLIAVADTRKDMFFGIDSLGRMYDKDSLLTTLYNKRFGDQHVTIAISRFKDEKSADEKAGTVDIEFNRRETSDFPDFFVLGIIILLIVYALVINFFNKKFLSFYNLGRAFSVNIREEVAFKGKIFDGDNLPIFLAHSLLVAFVGIFLLLAIDAETPVISGFGRAFRYWFIIAFLVFIFFILKYWLLLLLGQLFKLPFVNRHYLEYVRLSKIFFAIAFLAIVILYMGANLELFNIGPIMAKFLILFLILRVLLLYFKFSNSSSFKKLYLFSYLCSTELLPMIIGLKILLN